MRGVSVGYAWCATGCTSAAHAPAYSWLLPFTLSLETSRKFFPESKNWGLGELVEFGGGAVGGERFVGRRGVVREGETAT